MKIHWIWSSILIVFLIFINVFGFYYFEEESSKVAILGLSGVILAAVTSVFTVVINNMHSKKREYEFLVFKEKQKTYEYFYEALFLALNKEKQKKDKEGKIILPKEAVIAMSNFKKGIMSWGSEKIIQEYLDYEEKLITNNEVNNTLKIANDFLISIRKELGYEVHKNTPLVTIILDNESRFKFKVYFKN